MECPLCHRQFEGWRPLHRHLGDEHSDAVALQPDPEDGTPVFRVACPSCSWVFAQRLRGLRRDPTFMAENRDAISLVAFDQLMMHWVEDHIAETEEASTGGGDDDIERV